MDLLMCGDIEANPGPTSKKLTQEEEEQLQKYKDQRNKNKAELVENQTSVVEKLGAVKDVIDAYIVLAAKKPTEKAKREEDQATLIGNTSKLLEVHSFILKSLQTDDISVYMDKQVWITEVYTEHFKKYDNAKARERYMRLIQKPDFKIAMEKLSDYRESLIGVLSVVNQRLPTTAVMLKERKKLELKLKQYAMARHTDCAIEAVEAIARKANSAMEQQEIALLQKLKPELFQDDEVKLVCKLEIRCPIYFCFTTQWVYLCTTLLLLTKEEGGDEMYNDHLMYDDIRNTIQKNEDTTHYVFVHTEKDGRHNAMAIHLKAELPKKYFDRVNHQCQTMASFKGPEGLCQKIEDLFSDATQKLRRSISRSVE